MRYAWRPVLIGLVVGATLYFFPFGFPLLFFLAFFFMLRLMFWARRGPWGHRGMRYHYDSQEAIPIDGHRRSGMDERGEERKQVTIH